MLKCEFRGLKTTDVGRSLARSLPGTHTITHAHARCLSISSDGECDLIL